MASTKSWNADTYEPLVLHLRKPKRSGVTTPMPSCRFGVHCKRSGCVYTHPVGTGDGANGARRMCLAFLSGACRYDGECWYRHPSCEGERQAVVRLLARQACTNPKPCPFGAACLFRCTLP